MAKIRIYELARDLNMTNKALIEKLTEMNVDVKSHMSSLDEDEVANIKSNLFGAEKLEVEETRVKPTVIRRRRKKVVVQETAPEPQPEAETEAEAVEAETAAEEDTATQPENPAAAEEAPAEAPAQATSESAAEQPEEQPETGASEQPSEAETEQPAEAAEEPAPREKTKPKKAAKTKKKEAAAKIIRLPVSPKEKPAAAKPKAKPKRADVAPLPSQPAPAAESEKDLRRKKAKKKPGEGEPERRFPKKKTSFRKKSVIEANELYARGARGRRARKTLKAKTTGRGQETQITTPKAIKRRIKIDDTIMLSDLAKRMGIKANEMIKTLMGMGVMATVNQTIDFDTAALVASEFNYEVERAAFEEETLLKTEADDPAKLTTRAPVVTIMGHVDHGKTSLLDIIRQTHVTDAEAGGITQHIGAYHVTTPKGTLAFLDTPGHEAFTAMRARGAKITDIVVLVVAADDGVMPQTVEAINHSKAAGVPIIVAVNKIDKNNADPDRVKRQLAEVGLTPEEWGGDTIFVHVSAKQKIGLDELLEMILLQAEVLELKANADRLASAYVVEAKIDAGRGPVATVLVQQGTLHTGDPVVCGVHYGKVRALFDDQGNQVEEARPSFPVEVLGLNGVPMAGDELVALEDEKSAKQVSMHRTQKQRSKELAMTSRMSLEGLYERMQEGEVKELNLIIKADVHGSIEALSDSLTKLSNEEVKINVIHTGTGAISETDVSLAAVSDAIIIGFNVRPSPKAHALANEEKVDMRFHNVIYNVFKEVKDAILGMMSSTFEERTLGRAEVRQVFHVPRIGTIAGCYVTDGKIERNQLSRLLRDGVVQHQGKIGSLRRYKDDVKEVQSGYECGVGLENYNDIKVGDEIECYYIEEIKPELE